MPALDGLRAVAVLMVMLFHGGMRRMPGDLGVTAFFVLSGFLITTLLLREHASTGDLSVRRFYLRRTLRIFPADYVVLAVTLAWELFRGDRRVLGVIGWAAAYLMNYYNALRGHPVSPYAHAWSLAIEEQFYLLWPVLLLALLRRYGARGALVPTLGLVCAVLTWRAALVFSGTVDMAYAYNALDTRLDSLLLGCALAMLARRTLPAAAERALQVPWGPAATMALLVAVRLLLPPVFRHAVGFTLESLLSAVLIAQLLVVHAAPAWRWLDHRGTRYLGALSYSLYLYHVYPVELGRRLEGLLGPAHHVVGILGAIVMAMGSYHLVERPFLGLKDRLAAGRHRPAPAGGTA
jgi:peptidoglycan/LPS O-acetylase OafA/YrhL